MFSFPRIWKFEKVIFLCAGEQESKRKIEIRIPATNGEKMERPEVQLQDFDSWLYSDISERAMLWITSFIGNTQVPNHWELNWKKFKDP